MNPVFFLLTQHSVLMGIGYIIADLLMILVGLKVLQIALEHTNLKTWLQLLVQFGKRGCTKFARTVEGLVDNRKK